MSGYQSDSNAGSPSSSYWNTRGEFMVEGNRPFPPGVQNDVWKIIGFGSVGGMYNVFEGDILFCINDNAGGNFVQNAWTVIPHIYPSP